MRFKINGDKNQVSVEYSFNGPRDIKGEDLINSEVDVVSTDEHLATINSDCNLTFTVIIQKVLDICHLKILEISLGQILYQLMLFTPVRKVVYSIEKCWLKIIQTLKSCI